MGDQITELSSASMSLTTAAQMKAWTDPEEVRTPSELRRPLPYPRQSKDIAGYNKDKLYRAIIDRIVDYTPRIQARAAEPSLNETTFETLSRIVVAEYMFKEFKEE